MKLDFVITGENDLILLTPIVTVVPGATSQAFLNFIRDRIANEGNETFSLRLNYDRNLFLPTDDLSADELNVTIIDGNGKSSMQVFVYSYALIIDTYV